MAGKQNKPYRKRDIYQEVTDRILGYLEEGTVPWRNPVQRGNGDGYPKNMASGKRYRGINFFLLSVIAMNAAFSSDYWMTFKQAKAAGGTVRKGEKGSLVTFWKMHDTRDRETGEEIAVPVLRHYTAFNLDQIDGVTPPDAPEIDPGRPPFEPLEQCDAIVAGYENRPRIEHGGTRARYRPSEDTVYIPGPDQFDCRENYYCTLFHELSHSTGHSQRLNRGLDTDPSPFGDPDYSREELVAEMSAAFLCAAAGISPPTIEQSAAYLQGWIKVLKGDKRLIVASAGAAQKSADHILGVNFHDEALDAPAIEVAQRPDPAAEGVDTSAPDTQLDLF